MIWRVFIAVAAASCLAGLAYFDVYSGGKVRAAVVQIAQLVPIAKSESKTQVEPAKVEPRAPWDGTVTLTDDEKKALGYNAAVVLKQTKPISLELTGRTDYDQDTLTKVRPRFDALVQKVHAKMGQKVRKGDALVDLFSTELAAAKTDLQVSYVQWRHDLRLYNVRVDLEKTKAIARQVLVDTANDLMKSRLAYATALGKLKIFEVPDEDVDVLLVDLGDEKISEEKFGKIADKARMTLRAPADGIVITREVVPGNYYESGSLLMTTAPLDHLWVWVNLYAIDQDKVRLGQIMEIDFPFLDDKIRGKVEYIANEVAKDTRAVRVRASIPNLDGRLKSDMVVRAFLEIPPLDGQTIVPRKSVIALNGEEYVFVQSEKNANKFERKQIRVAQEKSDFVVVASGLKAGQVVATMGALILAQMYEDEGMIETGLPTQ